MTLSLSKGQNLSLAKADPSLQNIRVGLGWDARSTDGAEFDLDASAVLVQEDRKVGSDEDFVFYNQMGDVTVSGGVRFDEGRASVKIMGDNRNGEGEGDDEQILIHLDRVPTDIATIVITVSIHDANNRGQNFGQVRNAFVRLVNEDTGVEVIRYDLSEDYADKTVLIFAEIYRYQGEWKFRAVGQGYADGLGGIAREFGVNL